MAAFLVCPGRKNIFITIFQAKFMDESIKLANKLYI